MSPVLQTAGLTLRYGRFTAIDNVSLSLHAGRRYGVLGPNGAGKTSLLNLLSGTSRASSGAILLDGIDVTARSPAQRRHAGLGRSFQKTSVFADMSVLDNLRLSVQSKRSWQLFDPWSPRSHDREVVTRAADFAEQVGLTARLGTCAAALSYGELRQLEVGLALATEPRVLLLDEPTAGMSEEETHAIVAMLQTRLPTSLTLLIIEHDLRVIEGLTDHVFVFESGALFEQGTPAEIRASERVQRVYFKGPAHA
ncbi:ABC transporter ATP-binding protein [Ramlibacter sp. PS3R-8]|uniref:ABC transporter ATP-binding protein n=1 Tax=Ramlibacter sp. PS3R-8 TaxID=3133437 RepID=UPI0030B7919F